VRYVSIMAWKASGVKWAGIEAVENFLIAFGI